MSATFPATRRVHRDRAGRWYETPDGTFPSVTNILSVVGKPALIAWSANTERELVIEASANLYEDLPLNTPKMSRPTYITTLTDRLGKQKAHQKELAKACEIGSAVHGLVEWNLRKELGQVVGPEPRLTGPALWAFSQWEAWRKSVDLEPIWVEQTIYSKTHGYAGTLDLAAHLEIEPYGKCLAVLDWKTGKAIYAESHLQNVAYARAYHEMGHAPESPVGLIVRLPKVENDPQFEVCVVPREEQEELFAAFLAAKRLWEWQQGVEAIRTAKRDGR